MIFGAVALRRFLSIGVARIHTSSFTDLYSKSAWGSMTVCAELFRPQPHDRTSTTEVKTTDDLRR